MTSARAAEVLRGDGGSFREIVAARLMGAEALELLHWWFTEANEPHREAIRVQREESEAAWTSDQWVAAVRAEWEKERKG